MSSTNSTNALPDPPAELTHQNVVLQFWATTPGDDQRGFVPAYHFRIVASQGIDVGHINVRFGNTQHLRLCAGHIGYHIRPEHRGQGFAAQACLAIADFVSSLFKDGDVIITCDPDNIASIKTIEHIGGVFIDEVDVSEQEPQFEQGTTRKKRYRWPVPVRQD